MASISNQQIDGYYERFGNVGITFTKEIADTLRLVRNQIFFKYKDGQRPCIIYSGSFTEAKIVIALTDDLVRSLREEKAVALRLCFLKKGRSDTLSFFIQSRISGISRLDENQDLHLVQLSFTQRPPDDFIEILGTMLEAAVSAARRKDERIDIDAESMRLLGISARNSVVHIEGVPRNGILKDLAFDGLKLIIMGNWRGLIGKTATVRLEMTSGEFLEVRGSIVRFDPIEERKSLAAIAIRFERDSVPLEYRMMLSEGLKQMHRGEIEPTTPSRHRL